MEATTAMILIVAMICVTTFITLVTLKGMDMTMAHGSHSGRGGHGRENG
ncbi:MAG: hypothetical protein LBB24_01910 [Rickettsiales bacterium]|jgi:hypothetical protein|nr:hypothetical protein [Rickettsiales bacterium]